MAAFQWIADVPATDGSFTDTTAQAGVNDNNLTAVLAGFRAGAA